MFSLIEHLGQGLGYYSNLAILYYVGSRIIHSYRNKEEPAISERITNLDDKVDRLWTLATKNKKDDEEIMFSRKRKRSHGSAETISGGKRPKQTSDEYKQDNDEDGIEGSCSQGTDGYNFHGERQSQNNPIINIKNVGTFAMNSKIIHLNRDADIHPQATETCDE